MWEDPIVAEVHRTRERLAAECGMSVKAVFADLRKRQVSLGKRLVRPPRRPDSATRTDRGPMPVSPHSPPADPTTAN